MASQLSPSAELPTRVQSVEPHEQQAEPERLRFVQTWRLDPMAVGSFGFLMMGLSILVFGHGQTRLVSAVVLLGLAAFLFARSLRLTERLTLEVPSGRLERDPSRRSAAGGQFIGRCTSLRLGSGARHADYALWAQLDTGEQRLLLRHRHPHRVLRSAREVSQALNLELSEDAWQHTLPEYPSDEPSRPVPHEHVVTPYRSRAILVAALLVTLDLALLTWIKLRDGATATEEEAIDEAILCREPELPERTSIVQLVNIVRMECSAS